MNQKNYILVAVLALFVGALLFLRGCDGPTPNPTPNPNPGPTTPAPVSTGVQVKTYADGKVVATIDATEIKTTDDTTSLDYTLKSADASGNTTGHVEGTWVATYNSWQSSTVAARFNVTLYSGNKVVGTWKVRNFSTDQRTVLLFPSDGGSVVRVSGNVLVETITGTTGGAATERVTLNDGDRVLYSKDLAWSVKIKHYLQGQPANGAGLIFLWGDFKVEPIKN